MPCSRCGAYLPPRRELVDKSMDYKNAKWERLRQSALRRDQYICRNCRRYGRMRSANTVHHVWPAEEYPEYESALWNLISLCAACHNSMHDRDTHALTALGRQWKDRTYPPGQGRGYYNNP